MRPKYKNKYRVKVEGVPDFVFFAPSKQAAKVFTEMCGYVVASVTKEK